MQGKQNKFGAEYGNREIITEKLIWINNLEKELQGLEGPKARNTRRFIQSKIKKCIKLENARPWWLIDTGLKRFTSIQNGISKWIDALKKQKHRNEWVNDRPPSSKKIPPLKKENASNNYRSRKSLSMMLKILPTKIREEIFDSLKSHYLSPEEQKGLRKVTKATGVLVYWLAYFMRVGNITIYTKMADEVVEFCCYLLYEKEEQMIWFGLLSFMAYQLL